MKENNKENCVVKITDGRAQVNRFLLHFSRLKKGKGGGHALLQKIKEITIYSEGAYVSAWLTARCHNGIIRAASKWGR